MSDPEELLEKSRPRLHATTTSIGTPAARFQKVLCNRTFPRVFRNNIWPVSVCLKFLLVAFRASLKWEAVHRSRDPVPLAWNRHNWAARCHVVRSTYHFLLEEVDTLWKQPGFLNKEWGGSTERRLCGSSKYLQTHLSLSSNWIKRMIILTQSPQTLLKIWS